MSGQIIFSWSHYPFHYLFSLGFWKVLVLLKKNGDSRALLYTESCFFWLEFWCLLGHAATAQVTLKSIPSLNTSQQISLGPHAPRMAKITHLDFFHQINNALEVKIMGQVTIFSSLPPRIFLSHYLLFISFLIRAPLCLMKKSACPLRQASRCIQYSVTSWSWLMEEQNTPPENNKPSTKQPLLS